MSKLKTNALTGKRSLFLAINGLTYLGITVYQWNCYFSLRSFFEDPKSPWLVLFFIPLVFGIIFILLAILNQKKVNAIQKFLDSISRNRKVITIIVFFVSTVIIYIISHLVKLDDALINVGMSGVGLLLYSMVLILLFFILFKGNGQAVLSTIDFFQ